MNAQSSASSSSSKRKANTSGSITGSHKRNHHLPADERRAVLAGELTCMFWKYVAFWGSKECEYNTAQNCVSDVVGRLRGLGMAVKVETKGANKLTWKRSHGGWNDEDVCITNWVRFRCTHAGKSKVKIHSDDAERDGEEKHDSGDVDKDKCCQLYLVFSREKPLNKVTTPSLFSFFKLKTNDVKCLITPQTLNCFKRYDENGSAKPAEASCPHGSLQNISFAHLDQVLPLSMVCRNTLEVQQALSSIDSRYSIPVSPAWSPSIERGILQRFQ